MRRVSTTALCLAFAITLSAQSPAGPVLAPNYAEEAAILENLTTRVRFEQDGTQHHEVSARIRVQSAAGVQEHGTVYVPFSREFTTVNVAYVRVRKPNGSVAETPTASAIDLAADVTRSAPTFTDLYVKHINVQALQPGDVLEYAFSLETRPLLPNHYWFDYSFETDIVTLEEVLELAVPIDSNKTPVVKHVGLAPEITTTGGRQTYRWLHRQLKKLSDQELQVLAHERREIRADVQVTSFKDWAALGEEFRSLWRGRAEITPSIRTKARELTTGAATDEAKLAALYKFVATEIRYVAVNIGIGRYRPHAAAEVLAAGFGDCKDKHILLVALLSAVGISADAALIGPGDVIDSDVPSPSQFSHVITAVTRAGKTTWMDTTLEVAPLGMLSSTERDAKVLTIPNDGPAVLARTPKEPARSNTWHIQVDGAVSAAGKLDASVIETISGDLELVMRSVFRGTPEARWPNLARGLSIGARFGGTASDVVVSRLDDTSTPIEIRYRYSVEKYSDWDGKNISAALPAFIRDIPDSPRPVVPIKMGPPVEIHATSRLQLPEGFEAQLVAGAARETSTDNEFGRHVLRTTLNGRVFEAERRWSPKVEEIATERFAAYDTFNEEIGSLRYSVTLRATAPWAWNEFARIDWYENTTGSTTKALEDAVAAAKRRDYQEGLALAGAVLEREPTNDAAAVVQAWIHLESGYRDRMHEVLRPRIATTTSPSLLKQYATSLEQAQRHQDALAVWQQGHQRFPNDHQFALYLGESLFRAGRHREAVEVLESQREREKSSARLHFVLGRSYLGVKNASAAIATLGRSVELDPAPLNLNNVAWWLAEASVGLDQALDYATRAVKRLSEELNGVSLADLTDAQVRRFGSLTQYWDTLGWVMYRRGDYSGAERYLGAAWTLAYRADFANRLADVMIAQQKTAEASRYVAHAATATATGNAQARERLSTMVTDVDARITALADAREALAKLKTHEIARPATASGEGDVFVTVGQTGTIESARFISGSPGLVALTDSLPGSALPWPRPDDDLARVIRRARVVCPLDVRTCSLTLVGVIDVTSTK